MKKLKIKCKRCGMCCLSVPNWNSLSDMDRAMLRKYDRNAEPILRKVSAVHGCPNLAFKGKKAICLIYSKRCSFCKALKYGSPECKYARKII
jgi:Fe-S-cluster containining protein